MLAGSSALARSERSKDLDPGDDRFCPDCAAIIAPIRNGWPCRGLQVPLCWSDYRFHSSGLARGEGGLGPFRASAPFPVSISVNSWRMIVPPASAKRATAARWASMPKPERSCRCVETRAIAVGMLLFPSGVQTANHRLQFAQSTTKAKSFQSDSRKPQIAACVLHNIGSSSRNFCEAEPFSI